MSRSLRFLYNTVPGRMILKPLTKPGVSKVCGGFLDNRVSKVLIPHFIKKNKIDMREYIETKYKSFNDFFCRQIKKSYRVFDPEEDSFVAPCDGYLSTYSIKDGLVIPVKNSMYRIEDLLGDGALAKEFEGGVCLVYRLCVNNYHRYCFNDDGIVLANRKIPGKLHTVRPIAQRRIPVFTENAREYSVLETQRFGKLIQMEVGALLVGRIVNNIGTMKFVRGQEKGHFEYGGSTIIQLIKPNQVDVPLEMFIQTESGNEVPVKMGQKIGTKSEHDR